jgi:hypothetical protein
MQDDYSLPRSLSKTRTVVRSDTPIDSTDDSTPTRELTCFNTSFELREVESTSGFLLADSELPHFELPKSEPATSESTSSDFLTADSELSYYDTMNDQNKHYDGDRPNHEDSSLLSTPRDDQSDDYTEDSNSLSTMEGEF